MLAHLARTARLSRPVSRLPLRALHSTPAARSAGDPYLLPHTPQHISPSDAPAASGAHEPEVDLSDPELPFPTPLPRDGETLGALRARLVYQSRKRGTLEGDLLMSTFGQEHMGGMSEAELREFDKVRSFPPLWLALSFHVPASIPHTLFCFSCCGVPSAPS